MRRQAFIARQSELPTITMLFAAVHESGFRNFWTWLDVRVKSVVRSNADVGESNATACSRR